jgi:hypothetical protein
MEMPIKLSKDWCEIGQVPIWSLDLKLLPNIEQCDIRYYLLKNCDWNNDIIASNCTKKTTKCFIYFPRFLPSALVRSHTQPVLHSSPLLFSCLLVKVRSHLLTLFSLDLILGQVHITWLIHVKCFIYFPRFLPSDLHWGTQHQSLESLMGISIFTVVFTFTSGVATQTGRRKRGK